MQTAVANATHAALNWHVVGGPEPTYEQEWIEYIRHIGSESARFQFPAQWEAVYGPNGTVARRRDAVLAAESERAQRDRNDVARREERERRERQREEAQRERDRARGLQISAAPPGALYWRPPSPSSSRSSPSSRQPSMSRSVWLLETQFRSPLGQPSCES